MLFESDFFRNDAVIIRFEEIVGHFVARDNTVFVRRKDNHTFCGLRCGNRHDYVSWEGSWSLKTDSNGLYEYC